MRKLIHSDRSDQWLLGSTEGVGEAGRKEQKGNILRWHKETFGMMNIFIIIIVVMVSQV